LGIFTDTPSFPIYENDLCELPPPKKSLVIIEDDFLRKWLPKLNFGLGLIHSQPCQARYTRKTFVNYLTPKEGEFPLTKLNSNFLKIL